MIEIVGIVGSSLLAFCSIPLLIDSIRNPTSLKNNGVIFLLMWYFGEIFTLFYYIMELGVDIPTLINYSTNILILSYLCYKRIF